jgi:hypothetical protein
MVVSLRRDGRGIEDGEGLVGERLAVRVELVERPRGCRAELETGRAQRAGVAAVVDELALHAARDDAAEVERQTRVM